MWISSFVFGGLIWTLIHTPVVMRQATLLQRLKAFRHSLIIAVLFLVGMAITYWVEVRIADPSGSLAPDDQVGLAWFKSVSDAKEAMSFLVAGVVAMFALLALQLLSVMAALRQFVVAQELDMATRDQVALHRATFGAESEGIPVSGIGAPR